MRRARSLKLIAGLAAAGLALAACSSGSSTSGSTTSAAATSAAATSAAESSAAASGSASSGAAVSGPAEMTGDPASVKLGLAYDIGGRGDQSFNDLAAKSLDEASAAGVEVVGELTAGAGEPDSAKVDRLNQLIDSEAALAYKPLLIKRLRRDRARRQRTRSMRRLGLQG